MKVLIDTNILLDVILLREPHFELSKRVLQCCQSIVDGYIAVHTFSNMFYVLHETEDFSIEDSMQHQSSIACKLDYIVTRNVDDFEKATVPAVTPEEFLKLVHAEK